MMKRCSKTDVALLIGFCALATLFSMSLIPTGGGGDELYATDLRRKLRQNLGFHADEITKLNPNDIFPWAETNLKSVTEAPDPENEFAPLFWHIPKSGGTNAKGIYECLRVTISNRAGSLEKFGHDKDNEIIAFKPWGDRGPAYVNVDTTSFLGIRRAERLGLVPSRLADIIFTSFPDFAIDHLYDEEHRGRALGLFRNPVDRLVSKFYYLQVADWELTYSPNWANLKINYWARYVNPDNNSYVRKLAGKKMNQPVDSEDLQIAMNTIREKFVVGLMDDMEESIRRFNIFLGIHESEERSVKCMDTFFGDEALKKNSNTHPHVVEGSSAWKLIARLNSLDMILWEFIQQLYDEQKEIIDSYANTMVVQQ